MKSLGSFLERHEVSRTEANLMLQNGNPSPLSPKKISVDEWLFEWGSPSEVIEFTREQIFQELLKQREDERQRIGQELHDSAGQLLLALQLSLARLGEAQKGGEQEELVGEIQGMASLIGQEIRSLAFLNHTAGLHASGLASALKSLATGFGKRTGCQVDFKAIGRRHEPSRASSLALLRVAQEALVNVHRYAHASHISIRLVSREKNLELTIADNGIGMPSPERLALNGGVGVEGMRFRVERLGGEFRIGNAKPGTKISAIVPHDA